MARPKPGRFTPKYPEKYVGDVKNIIYRSSWELKFMKFLDLNAKVKKWGSEEVAIPYFDPVTNANRRYFPDFVFIVEKHGEERKIMAEIKPFAETIQPEPRVGRNGKPPQSYLVEEATYLTNQAKWDAAVKFCATHNMTFCLMTEYELGLRRR